MSDDIVIYGADNKPMQKVQYDLQGNVSTPIAPFEGPTVRTPRGVRRKVDLTSMMQQLISYNPKLWPFDPGIPLSAITTGGEAIRWAPQTGYNLTYSPDKKIGIANSKLRLFADQCAGIRVVMEQLKREYVGLDKDIVPKDPTDDELAASKDRTFLQEWLLLPDGKTDLEQWEMMVIEDMMVIGAPALWRMHNFGGKAVGLRPIDSALVTPIVTAMGLAPESPAPAFYFNAYSLPYREYTEDELIYKPFNMRTWTPYGFGPVEATISYVLLQIYRSLYYVNRYDRSDLPPGFLTMPENWTEKNVLSFADAFAEKMSGEDSERHSLQFFPNGAKYQEVKQMPDWQYEFDEYLMRVFSWMIGVAPTPIIKQQSMGKGSEGLSEEALAAGVRPLEKFIKRIIDRYIADTEQGMTPEEEKFPRGFGMKGYEYNIVEEREENKELKLNENMQLQASAVKTINAIRADYGLDELDEDEYPQAGEPMFKLATGWVPLKSLAIQTPEEMAAKEQEDKQHALDLAAAGKPTPGAPGAVPGGPGGPGGGAAPGNGGSEPGEPGGAGGGGTPAPPGGSKSSDDGGDGAAKVAKGDVPDHDFHGNQYATGVSAKADAATVEANKASDTAQHGTKEDHAKAAEAHTNAAEAHRDAVKAQRLNKNPRLANAHKKIAEIHDSLAAMHRRLAAFSKVSKAAPLTAEDNAGPQPWKLAELDSPDGDFTVYLVDGDWVESNIDPDYTQGTNGYAHPAFCPENEIWIDNRQPEYDRQVVLEFHELPEIYRMRDWGEDYDTAHAYANGNEQAHRQSVKYEGQPRQEHGRFGEGSDLRKWERMVKARVKAGKPVRAFESDAINPARRAWIEAHLMRSLTPEGIAKAFTRPKRADVRTWRDSKRAKEAGEAIKAWFTPMLRKWADHYKAIALRELESRKGLVALDGGMAKGDIWTDPEITDPEAYELVGVIAAGYDAGVQDTVELLGGGRVKASEYAQDRAGKLIGKVWNPDTERWVNNPDRKWYVPGTVRDKIKGQIERAVTAGEGSGGLSAAIEDMLITDIPYRAELIGRTELRSAYNNGAAANMRSVGVNDVEISDGSGYGDECDDRNGEVVSLDDFLAMDEDEHPNGTLAMVPVLETMDETAGEEAGDEENSQRD